MKKIVIMSLILLALTCQAQFVGKAAPTDIELKINNADSVPELLRISAITFKNKDFKNQVKALEKLTKIKPNIPLFQYKLAQAYSLNDNKSGAFNSLVALQKQGLYFDVANNKNFDNIKNFPVFEYIKNNLEANNSHFGEGLDVFKIDKSFSGLLFETLVVDSKNNRFLMGSLRDGRVIKVENNGNISNLIDPTPSGLTGPWSVIDLEADTKNNVLWVASAAISQYTNLSKESAGLAGIFKYNLTTGKLIKSYLLPEKSKPYLMANIHLAKNGKLYILESIRNSILELNQESGEFNLVLKAQGFKGLRKMTSDDTGRLLYVTDEEKGILVIDLEDKKTYLIENTPALLLAGISEIIYDDNGLIIIQAGNKPERVMRLQLNKTKLVVSNVFPIESAHPKFNNPAAGTIFDGGIYYIANSQLAKTNKYGGLLRGQSWDDVYIISSAKHYKEQDTLEYQKQVDKYRK
jgi:hypothetical protein